MGQSRLTGSSHIFVAICHVNVRRHDAEACWVLTRFAALISMRRTYIQRRTSDVDHKIVVLVIIHRPKGQSHLRPKCKTTRFFLAQFCLSPSCMFMAFPSSIFKATISEAHGIVTRFSWQISRILCLAVYHEKQHRSTQNSIFY